MQQDINLNDLYYLMNHRGGRDTKANERFPFECNKEIDQVVRHPGSRQLVAYIKKGVDKKNPLEKLLPNNYSELLEKCVSKEEKSVCAKLIKGGETIAECFDCRADPSCIICMDCFKNGNHKGHRVVFKKAGGGCCDCGDIEAWKEQGFCSKHTGKAKEVEISVEQRTLSNQILSELYFIYCWLKLTDSKDFNTYMTAFASFLSQMVQISLKGIKLISIFLEEPIPSTMLANSKLGKTPFQQLFNAYFASDREFSIWEQLFIEMFPYYPFKQQLLANYIKHYSSLYASEHHKGQSIACQIVTSYKLVEDYSESKDAVPIIIQENKKLSEVVHTTKMMSYDLNRINSLQGDAPLKYWTLVIKYGIHSLFGYYETLKTLARREKNGAKDAESKRSRKKKKKKAMQLSQEMDIEENSQDDVGFSQVQFAQRHNQIIESQYRIIEQFLEIMPLIAENELLILQLIRSAFVQIIKDIDQGDDLLIFRPYERMLGYALFFYAKQTPFLLSNPKNRETIRNTLALTEQRFFYYLSIIQKRMLDTFGFFSHLQSCQTQGYSTSFYTYIVLYASKYCLLGHTDILLLRTLVFLGAPQLIINFSSMAKLERLETSNCWTFRAFSALMTQLGLLYTGSFSEIYISFYSEKSTSPPWLAEQAKRVLRKFITAEGGSATLDRIEQFSGTFLFRDQDNLKTYLKEICSFNKKKKAFEILPQNIDKQPINFRDFRLRTNLENQGNEIMHPRLTSQLIDKANKLIFTYVWNQKNIQALCQILIKLQDQVQHSEARDKKEVIQLYSIPCKLLFLLAENEVLTNLYQCLSDLLKTFDVSIEFRKALGVFANYFTPLQENTDKKDQANELKEQMRLKKLKKLEQLKKKNLQNVQKIKAKHDIEAEEETNRADECVICRKTGGNLVWVAKMSIRNLEKTLQIGRGALTLSFVSCYHAFDYECIVQNAIKRSTHEYLFRCPVCRTLGNVFLSIASRQQVHENMTVEASLDRIMHVAMTMREYATFDIYEQIFKSFYHLALLGYVDPEYVLNKRMKLYKQIISVLCNKKLRDNIIQFEKKLERGSIQMEPSMFANKQLAVHLHNGDQDSYMDEESDSDEDFEAWENFLDLPPQAQMQEQKKQVKTKKEKNQTEKNKEKSKTNPLFYYLMKRIVTHILKAIDQEQQIVKEVSIQKQGPNEEPKMEVMEVQDRISKEQEKLVTSEQKQSKFTPEAWTIALLDELLGEKTVEAGVQLVPHNVLKLIELPERFYWDLTDSTCQQCGNVCSDIFLCLLCDWRGCLNNCKNDGLKGHNKKHHGQNGAFLRLKDANAYLIGPGELNKIGCLYLNEWGQQFQQSCDWNRYTLQAAVVNRVSEMLIRNQ